MDRKTVDGAVARGGEPDTPSTPSTPAQDVPPPPMQSLSQAAMLFALIVLLPVAGAVFAVMAVSQSSIANDQSQVANQIALLSLCYTNSSASFCSELLDQADTIVPALASKLYNVAHVAPKQPSILLDSDGGRPFLLASLVTFWVFVAASLVCTVWYSVETLWRWRRTRLATRKGVSRM